MLRKFTCSAWGVGLIVFVGLCCMMAGCQPGGKAPTSLMEAVKDRGKLIAGIKYDSKPFGYLDADGEVKGYDVDLMRELAKRILGDANAVEFQQVLSSTRVVALDSGAVDAVAATMTITPEREKVIDFTNSYYTARQGVMVPLNSPVKKLEDLSDKTVLIVMGTTSEANIKKRLPKAKYLPFKSTTEAFSALKGGRGDAMTTDDTLLAGFLADNCGFRLLDERLSEEPYGLGVRQDAPTMETKAFRDKVNVALAEMQKDGTLAGLKRKWIDAHIQPKACK